MTIRFDQKIDDIAAFYRYHKFIPKRARSSARMSAFIAIVPLVLIMALRGAFADSESKIISLIVIAATYFIAYVILLDWGKRRYGRYIRRLGEDPDNVNYFGEKKFTFNQDNVEAIDNISHNIIKWKGFVKVVEIKDYFFLYLAKENAFIIPKEALSAAEVEEFRTLLLKYIPEYQG